MERLTPNLLHTRVVGVQKRFEYTLPNFLLENDPGVVPFAILYNGRFREFCISRIEWLRSPRDNELVGKGEVRISTDEDLHELLKAESTRGSYCLDDIFLRVIDDLPIAECEKERVKEIYAGIQAAYDKAALAYLERVMTLGYVCATFGAYATAWQFPRPGTSYADPVPLEDWHLFVRLERKGLIKGTSLGLYLGWKYTPTEQGLEMVTISSTT